MQRQMALGLTSLLSVVVLFAASCGGADTGNTSQGMNQSGDAERGRKGEDTSGGAAPGKSEDGYSDRRFIDGMIPHHRSAVEMAEVALENAEHRRIAELSTDIISTQEAEITELRAIKRTEFGTSEVSSRMGTGQMPGMGMMDAGDLAGRDPFDRAFIDAMIPHHASAVEMAETAGKRSENPRIRALASDIVDAQEREISQLRSWREEWFPEG